MPGISTSDNMSNVSVTGIVISSMPIGEYDRRLELLTGSYGRISVFARGARKPSSELVAVSRVFALGQFELFQGKTSYTLKGARISNYFEELSKDIDLTYYGFYFLEICRYFSRENIEASDVLRLLSLSLKALESDSFNNRLVRSVFELKMLDINGICPSADEILDPSGRILMGRDLSQSAAYTVRFVLSSPLDKLFSFRLSPEVLAEFSDITDQLMKFSVDKKFKSLEFIDK